MKKRNRAFGLIETLIACAILIMAAGAATSLSLISVQSNVISRDQTEAYNLAQEAIEKIKAEREHHWPDFRYWVEKGLPTAEIAKTKFFYINHQNGKVFGPYDAPQTNFSGTEYKREVKIEALKDNLTTPSLNEKTEFRKITVTVSWLEYGQNRSISLSTFLTNWKPMY